MADVTVKRLEEFEAIFGGGFRRVRAGLGVSSFGLSVMDFPPGFSQYPEHDHGPDGQEEVYTVLAGTATLTAGGRSYELEPGVFAFTRAGDAETQRFALQLGAEWAGDSEGGSEVSEPTDAGPPEPLDAAIIFAPVGALVPVALRAVAPGGTVVCAGIHMSDIPTFPYEILWGERTLRSVANLTRLDGEEFMALAPRVTVRTEVAEYPLERANEALGDLRHGRFRGAAVLVI